MAGCTKADRQRKSASNIAYISGNRMQVNKERKMKRAKQRMEKAAKKWAQDAKPKRTIRGSARNLRRKALQMAYTGA